MSLRDEKIKSLLGTNLDDLSEEELKKLCNKILKSKIHGICFSLYEGTQQPGDIVSDDQIMRRLEILKPYTSSIRTFSSLDEHARIVKIAKDMGFKTLVGAWLSDDMQSNDKEIEGLIELANHNLVDVAAVGNEVIYRKDLLLNKFSFYEGLNFQKAREKILLPFYLFLVLVLIIDWQCSQKRKFHQPILAVENSFVLISLVIQETTFYD